MVILVITITEIIRSAKCNINKFRKKLVRNRKLRVYYLILFTFRAKMGQEDLFAFDKVSYEGDFLKA